MRQRTGSHRTLRAPVAPMEALSARVIPAGPGWQYEPKWDGFRCLAFRDGASVELFSKAGHPLTRYFPELVAALSALAPHHFVLDGEIVLPHGHALSFDLLLARIHPAISRIQRLARETPARFVAFDLLADERGRPLTDRPLSERRMRLAAFARRHLGRRGRLTLSPATTRVAVAEGWLEAAGGGLDGIVAKRRDEPYRAGERAGMVKVKRVQTVECVVGGWRRSAQGGVGSLLLGLYDSHGRLHHVGYTVPPAAVRRALEKELVRLEKAPGFTGRAPGGPSRWSAKGKSAEWTPLAPRLVIEVTFDHFSDGRFRHGTKFLRLRPDKPARRCTLDQVVTRASLPRSFSVA